MACLAAKAVDIPNWSLWFGDEKERGREDWKLEGGAESAGRRAKEEWGAAGARQEERRERRVGERGGEEAYQSQNQTFQAHFFPKPEFLGTTKLGSYYPWLGTPISTPTAQDWKSSTFSHLCDDPWLLEDTQLHALVAWLMAMAAKIGYDYFHWTLHPHFRIEQSWALLA